MLAATALALVLADRGAGGWAIAALLLAAAVPPVVLAPAVGRIADRLDSRKILVVTGLAQVAVCVALAYAEDPVLVVGLVAVLAGGLALTQPTLSALVPLMVGRENLPKASGISQTINTMGMLIAPAAGGILVGQFGARVPLLIDAATYLALPIGALVIKTRRGGAAVRKSGERAVSAKYRIRNDRLLWPLLVMIVASIGAISAVNVIEVFFVRETLHGSPTMYGLISATWLLGILVGAVIWSRLKHESVRTAKGLAFLLIAAGVVFVASAAAPNVGWLLPIWLVGGVINGGINVSAGVMLGTRVPPEVRGQAGARFNSMANAANASGYLLGGVLLAVWQPRVLVLACGIGGVLAVFVFARGLARAIRAERANTVAVAVQAPELIPAM